jgi:hypothetical protein
MLTAHIYTVTVRVRGRLDPCGIAGGYAQARGAGGQTPVGAQQGDLGSELPLHTGLKTLWKASGPHEVGFMAGEYILRWRTLNKTPRSECIVQI